LNESDEEQPAGKLSDLRFYLQGFLPVAVFRAYLLTCLWGGGRETLGRVGTCWRGGWRSGL
jgi:hypothetical protein